MKGQYGGCGILSIIDQDETLRKVGSWKWNKADKKLGSKILVHIIRKEDYTEEVKKILFGTEEPGFWK